MNDKNNNEFIDPIPESVRKTNEAIKRATEPILQQQELLNKLAESMRVQAQIEQSVTPIINQAAITQNIANAMRVNLPDFSQAFRSAALDIITARTVQFASLAASVTAQYKTSIYNTMQDAIRLPIMNWLNSINLSPIYGCLNQFGNLIPKNLDRRLFSDIYLMEMYEAKWFPYAGWDAELSLVKEILNILDTTRKSKNRVKRIDSVIYAYYDDKTVEAMKKGWRKKELPEHIMRMLHQSIQAYHRKEYALTIAVLATLWEGIIYEKVNLPHGTQKQTKESLDKLIEKNEFTQIFKSYYDEFIMYRCYKPEEVKEDVPGRNGVAHGWYSKYPSRKAALNAILFTDFLLALEPLQEEETNG